ncbi:MAG TPA: DUF4446 family protein [Fimbriimonadales bacterium]|nr:DUF4446 family protein [Fimbriimonadales bacterium]
METATLHTVFAVALSVAYVLLFSLWIKWYREIRLFKNILKGTKGESLEPILIQHFQDMERIATLVSSLERRISKLESKAQRAVSSVGVVRYNAFQEIGGEQSFALALQNELRDGVVINCITGRESVRFFCKPIENGKCEVGLTPEEEAAIELARKWTHPEPSG